MSTFKSNAIKKNSNYGFNLNLENIHQSSNPQSTQKQNTFKDFNEFNRRKQSEHTLDPITENHSPYKKTKTDYDDIFDEKDKDLNSKSNKQSAAPMKNILPSTRTDFILWEHKTGIVNLGNTCFVSAAVQILTHLRELIISLNIYRERRKKDDKSIFFLFLDILDRIEKGKKSIDIEEFYIYFVKKGLYEHNTQQDSQEFFRKLLDLISNECNNSIPIDRLTLKSDCVAFNTDPSTHNNSISQMIKDYLLYSKSIEDSFITETFYGSFITTFSCNKCKYKTYAFDNFLDFPLTFDEKRINLNVWYLPEIKLSVDYLLSNYFKPEQIEWEKNCNNKNCKIKARHTKQSKVIKLPKVIIVCLQRLSSEQLKKNTISVLINDELDFSQYIDIFAETINQSSRKYYLKGIINHTGSLDFGHYYSQVKINNKWVEFDDNKVNILDDRKDFSCSKAYTLVYCLNK